MVVEDQPAWSPNLRSRTRLRAASVRHFADPSLAVAALGIAPDRLLENLRYFGFLFESLVIRDLRIYAQAADARVYHYREKTGSRSTPSSKQWTGAGPHSRSNWESAGLRKERRTCSGSPTD